MFIDASNNFQKSIQEMVMSVGFELGELLLSILFMSRFLMFYNQHIFIIRKKTLLLVHHGERKRRTPCPSSFMKAKSIPHLHGLKKPTRTGHALSHVRVWPFFKATLIATEYLPHIWKQEIISPRRPPFQNLHPSYHQFRLQPLIDHLFSMSLSPANSLIIFKLSLSTDSEAKAERMSPKSLK